TAGSVTSDIAAVRAAIDAVGHRALLVVDVVASLAAAPFDMDGLGVNMAIGGSQKGLMLPPGLAFVAADETAQKKITANPALRFYWNWDRRQHPLSYMKFCGTPPEHLLFGLQASLRLIEREGLDNITARHARLAGAVHHAVQAWSTAGSINFFAREPACRSVSVTTVEVTGGFDPEAIRRVAREKFQVAMAGGNGPLIGRVFRIGHLGDLNPAMILGALGGIEAALCVQKVPYGEGALSSAAAWLAQTAGAD
ncbi:MAG: aminotransferase class V-fold PLP-dependent enzyme, partial [Burkholderiaceae bacterium]